MKQDRVLDVEVFIVRYGFGPLHTAEVSVSGSASASRVNRSYVEACQERI